MNQGPVRYKLTALTTELRPLMVGQITAWSVIFIKALEITLQPLPRLYNILNAIRADQEDCSVAILLFKHPPDLLTPGAPAHQAPLVHHRSRPPYRSHE